MIDVWVCVCTRRKSLSFINKPKEGRWKTFQKKRECQKAHHSSYSSTTHAYHIYLLIHVYRERHTCHAAYVHTIMSIGIRQHCSLITYSNHTHTNTHLHTHLPCLCSCCAIFIVLRFVATMNRVRSFFFVCSSSFVDFQILSSAHQTLLHLIHLTQVPTLLWSVLDFHQPFYLIAVYGIPRS